MSPTTFSPAVNTALSVGVDAGGTKASFRVVNSDSGKVIFEQTYQSDRFMSLDAMIDQFLKDFNRTPAYMYLVIAGPREENGDIKITNQPSWPLFSASSTAARLGISIDTANDMVGGAAGLATLTIRDQQHLKAGAPVPVGSKMILAASTGIGDATLLDDGTTVPGEGGHGTFQAMTRLEHRYVEFLRAKYGIMTITVEIAIGGKHGFDNMYEFLLAEGHKLRNLSKRQYKPTKELKQAVRLARFWEDGIGGLITSGAINGDAFCQLAMQLFGSILGQHTRNRVLGTLSWGGVFFVGSIMQAPGVANYVVAHTPFLMHFVSKGAEHSDRLWGTPMYVVTDPNVTVKGATLLAEQLRQR